MRGDTARCALRKLDSLCLRSIDRPELMLSTFPMYGAPAPVILDITGNGFTANRRLDRDEVEAIRDWCNAALEAVDTPDVAEAERMEA